MKKTVRDIDVKNKKVLVRCDFNVPMQDGKITDDIRITSALPTIRYLMDHGARVILMSHMGRPKGEAKMEYTLKPVAERLSQLLNKDVIFTSVPEVVNSRIVDTAAGLKPGEVMLLENVRFRKEETKNEAGFAKELAQLGEVFVNDAFGTAHRAHCSTDVYKRQGKGCAENRDGINENLTGAEMVKGSSQSDLSRKKLLSCKEAAV